jgi:hypothetical protein
MIMLFPVVGLGQPIRFVQEAISQVRRYQSTYYSSGSSLAADSGSLMLERLYDFFLDSLPRIPESLTMAVPSNRIGEPVHIVSSSDHKVRFWAWDSELGGEAPNMFEVVEFSGASGIRTYTEPLDSDEAIAAMQFDHWCDTLFSATSKEGITYYLPLERWVADRQNAGENLSAFTIEGDSLNFNHALFQTRTSLLKSIDFHYPEEVQSWEYEHEHTITIKDEGKVLLIPLVSSKGKMTSQHLRYDFDGEHYIYKGIE